MRFYFFAVLLFFASFSSFSQKQKVAEYYLGYRLVDNGSGELVRFGMIRISPNGATKITYMTKLNFFLQAAGKQDCRANKEKINYWKEYKLDVRTVDRLWKLKYAEYPYEKREDIEGWANLNFSASPGQLRFLGKYGFKKDISDFIYGDKCFQLLQDIQDPEWQYNYSMQ